MIARFPTCTLIVTAIILCTQAVSASQVAELAKAEQRLLCGNYSESEAAFAILAKQLPVQATLGLSRCLWELGKRDEAAELLDTQIAKTSDSAALHAQRAWIALHCGDWNSCRENLQRSFEAEPDHLQASWVAAELHRLTGNVEQACQAYRELAQRYDQLGKQIDSPRQLFWFGKALAQHARFNQDQKRFRQLTTQLYPRILALEPNFWPGHYETGKLLLEKFNASDAESAFNDALRINPQSADVQVGLARLALNEFQLDRVHSHVDRALRTNRSHLGALLCRADMRLASLRPADALSSLRDARALNPNNSATLGRIAATYSLLDKATSEGRLEDESKVLDTARTHGSTGEYYASQGVALEHARRYPQAGASFQRAIEAMPQLLGLRGQLGMIEMRLGHETKSRELLEASFTRDPYNVRVKNQLEVLDLLDSYATLETEHFVIRFDEAHDRLLARQMARYAEVCYDQLTATFDYQLPEKALLEVFHDGRGIKAREWFGVRMVGLPNIHTIAACGGNIVAMVSPTAERRKLNWADILRHEIVHLVNIQQTNYAVPHWLTEGCAVWQEDRPRRPAWNKLLVQRVPKGEVFNLDTINFGFLKPRSAEDWQLAYCQAELYINLIAEQHGVEGIRKLLAAYRDNLPVDRAIADSLGTTQANLEDTYAQQLIETAAQLGLREDLQPPVSLAELSASWKRKPTDWSTGSKLALARLRRGDYPGAGRLARQVLEAVPTDPTARYVKAKLLVRIGDEQAAATELQPLAETGSADARSLKLLASIRLRQGKLDQAKHWYSVGAGLAPDDLQWVKALAVVAIRQQDNAELNELLRRITIAEPDNLVARKKLLQLAQAGNDQTEIRRWADEVLHIDPNDRAATQAQTDFNSTNP